MTKSRYKPTKKALLFWTFFIGIGAIFGGTCMLIDPSGKLMGMDAMLPYFKKLPFSDILFANFVFSGVSLLIVNGLTNIIASILIIRNKKLGIIWNSQEKVDTKKVLCKSLFSSILNGGFIF